ncbi:MAG: hypothetical protein PHC45_00650 [Clostridiaceae bacterium]|nr:hypothetical protein [Clostridiaceae bacterium]
MEVKLDCLIPYEKAISDADSVFRAVENNDKVVLIKDNQPVYIIFKYDAVKGFVEETINAYSYRNTLHEAMRIVLSEAEDNTMHAAILADEIFKRGLYFQRDGGKAQYNQIRARCGHYPNLFVALPRNFIKLREDVL